LILSANCVFGVTAALAQTATSAQAGSNAGSNAGTVTHLSGTLTARNESGSTRVLAARSGVVAGETLSTAQDTFARVKFGDGTEIVIRPETRFKVEQYSYDEKKPESDNMVFSLLKGGLRSVSGLISKRNRDKIKYVTPTATVGIRGTHFGATVCDGDCPNLKDGLHVDVSAGAVAITNASGTQEFNAGQFAYVASNATTPVIVPPNQGFKLTLPPSMTSGTTGVGGSGADICRP
jgi:hypothetical protein